MSTEAGGNSDNELLSGLSSKYPTEACLNPSKINARLVDTKQPIPTAGWKQIIASYDIKKGFQCLQNQQPDRSACLDYEVQLCCPGILSSTVILFRLKCTTYYRHIFCFRTQTRVTSECNVSHMAVHNNGTSNYILGCEYLCLRQQVCQLKCD